MNRCSKVAARNGPDHFGWITRAIHWAMAGLIIGMLGLGLYIGDATPSLSNFWLFGLHKSLGMTALGMALLRILWHWISPPPAIDPAGLARWQWGLARLVRGVFYALMLLVPLSGWVASAAAGPDVIIFERWALPRIAPTSVTLEEFGFAVHAVLTKLMIGVLGLHIAGALYHQIVLGDGGLRRMIRGG